MIKTNAIRLLNAAKINIEIYEYEYDENDLSGIHAAEFLKIPTSSFYKTLVLKGAKNGIFVCCIPVDKELDLKKAAAVFGDKSCDMIPVKELLNIAGYMRGACTPVGMKKHFPIFFQNDITSLEKVYISGGARGVALKIKPDDIIKFVNGKIEDITK